MGDAAERAAIEAVLGQFLDLESGQAIAGTGQVQNLVVQEGKLSMTLGLSTFLSPLWQVVSSRLEQQLRSELPQLKDIDIEVVEQNAPVEPLAEVGLAAKSIVAVGSGKGGVGKSTIAVSLACGLNKSGARVGLLDADVYGPSIPHLLGVRERPEAIGRRLQPIVTGGLRIMSMGLLVPPGEAVVWRGPMLHGAITQMLRETDWGELDYLVIDMPPGTGDVALTLSQLLPLSGAVCVCTAQDVALLDAVKAIAMFRKVNIPILGVVENMSYFECTGCGQRHELFGHGGAKRRAEELEIPFLGEVPLNVQIRIRGDEGTSAGNVQDEESSTYFETMCQMLVENILAARRAEPTLPSL